MSECSKTTNGKHEWQSAGSGLVTCTQCEELYDQFGKVPDTPSHEEGCICNQCMSEEEYQSYISHQQATTANDLDWTIICPLCKTGLTWVITYPVKVKSKDEIGNDIEIDDYTVAYCENCKKDFDPFWDTDKDENLDTKTKPIVATGVPSVQYSMMQYKSCSHPPVHVINGKTYNIYAGRKHDVEDFADDYDIVLNLTGYAIHKRHEIPFQELSKWRDKKHVKYKEICLDWPDMGVVNLPKEFWIDLIDLFKKKKSKVLMFCIGGHGRTGTAMAVLMVLGLGWKPKDAVDWIRKEYCDKAIETWKQLDYIYSMVGETAPPSKERKDSIVYNSSDMFKGPCSDTCICVKCMPNEEYEQYKKDRIFPEAYLKRKAEQKEKESKESKKPEDSKDEKYLAAWGSDFDMFD
jgi:hypothetical protein